MGKTQRRRVIVGVGALFIFLSMAMNAFTPNIVTEDDPDLQPIISSQVTDRIEEMMFEERFIPNSGQLSDPEILFYASGPNFQAGFRTTGLVIILRSKATERIDSGPLKSRDMPNEHTTQNGPQTLEIVFKNARPIAPTGMEPTGTKLNFFRGQETVKWLTDVPAFSRLSYDGIYPGIDIVFRFNGRQLKYDVIVHPGSDLLQVLFEYSSPIGIGDNGELLIDAEFGRLEDARPTAAQGMGDHRSEIDCGFRSLNGNTVGFKLDASYDSDDILVIDPGFTYGTYLGGNSDDSISSIDMDENGNVYVAGYTESNDFPVSDDAYDKTKNGTTYDIFISKFDPTLSRLLFSTFIGGDAYEDPNQLLCTEEGDVILVGSTSSDDFPVTSDALNRTFNGEDDGFFLRLNDQGNQLLYSTYLGGPDDDTIRAVLLDDDGSLLLAGSTKSTNTIFQPGSYQRNSAGGNDVFILYFNQMTGEIGNGTYFGGIDSDGCGFLGKNNKDEIIIAGYTYSDLYVSPNAYCATYHGDYGYFIAGFNKGLTDLMFTTYYPSTGDPWENMNDIAIDSEGRLYIVGSSNSTHFPVTDDALYKTRSDNLDATLIILSSNGSELLYSTYFAYDRVNDFKSVVLDEKRQLLAMVGWTNSLSMPTTQGAFDNEFRSVSSNYGDGYLCVFNLSTMNVTYLTYYGGNLGDWFHTVDFSPNGLIYIAGNSDSLQIFTSKGAYSSQRSSTQDAIIVAFEPAPGRLSAAPLNFRCDASPDDVNLAWERPDDDGGCRILEYRLERLSTSGSWDVLIRFLNLSYFDYDVEPGRTYRYRVCAVTTLGVGAYAECVAKVPAILPTVPLSLHGGTGDGSVNLSWDHPVYNGGATITGYSVRRGPLRDSMTVVADLANVTTWTDTNATLGEFYYYDVAARNSVGIGPYSDAFRIKAFGPPDAPRDFAAEPGDGSVALSWALPSSTGGSMLLGFKIYRGESSTTISLLATKGPVDLSHTDTGLTNGRRYIYYMTAFSEVNESVPTVALDVVPFSVPGTPMNPETESGDGWLLLEWDPPESDGGSRILRYIVLRGETPTELDQIATLGNVTSFNNTGLTNGVTYHYAVVAVNEAGEGPRSTPASGRPMGLPSAPTDLAGQSKPGGIFLTWHAPTNKGGADVLTYNVYRGPNRDDLSLWTSVTGEVSFLDTEVTGGMRYFYVVAAENEVGEGLPSAVLEIVSTGVPGMVQDIVLRPMDGRVELSWKAPLSDGGSPITDYIIQRGLFETALQEVARVGTILNYTDAAVENSKRYFYAIQALNVIGAGPLSTPSPSTPLGVPRAPGVLKAGIEGSTVVLTWVAPTEGGRATVTGYFVLKGLDPAGLTELAEVGPVLSYTDTTVEKDKTYYYLVVANSTSGRGEAPTAPVKVKIEEKKDDVVGFNISTFLIAYAVIYIYIVYKRR